MTEEEYSAREKKNNDKDVVRTNKMDDANVKLITNVLAVDRNVWKDKMKITNAIKQVT